LSRRHTNTPTHVTHDNPPQKQTTQEPELLHTLYTTQGLPLESAELSFIMALRSLEDHQSPSDPAQISAGGSGGGGGRPDAAAAAKFVGAMERAAGEGRREGGLFVKGMSEFAALVKEQVGGRRAGINTGHISVNFGFWDSVQTTHTTPQINPPTHQPTNHPTTQKARLERDTGQALFVGLSLSDTLRACLRLGHAREAAAVRKQFGVPEARWVCRVGLGFRGVDSAWLAAPPA
jgi:hypothetical protein